MCRSFWPLILKQTVILTAMSHKDAISKHILDFPVPSLPERITTPCSCKNFIAFSTADVLTYVLSCLCCDISLYVFSEIKKNSTDYQFGIGHRSWA
jgi:hypothetical protein